MCPSAWPFAAKVFVRSRRMRPLLRCQRHGGNPLCIRMLSIGSQTSCGFAGTDQVQARSCCWVCMLCLALRCTCKATFQRRPPVQAASAGGGDLFEALAQLRTAITWSSDFNHPCNDVPGGQAKLWLESGKAHLHSCAISPLRSSQLLVGSLPLVRWLGDVFQYDIPR